MKPKVDKTVGVYDRPAKAKWRWAAVVIVLVVLAVAAAVFALRRGDAKTAAAGDMLVAVVVWSELQATHVT
jgi:hypothetical protein